jgi:hypothetical protein
VHLLKKAILDVSGNGFHITIGLPNESTREKKKTFRNTVLNFNLNPFPLSGFQDNKTIQ